LPRPSRRFCTCELRERTGSSQVQKRSCATHKTPVGCSWNQRKFVRVNRAWFRDGLQVRSRDYPPYMRDSMRSWCPPHTVTMPTSVRTSVWAVFEARILRGYIPGPSNLRKRVRLFPPVRIWPTQKQPTA
jgi:hypothetical protein